jgi:hypothetical protein
MSGNAATRSEPAKERTMNLGIKATLSSLFGFALFGLALFLPAGTFDYW